MGKAFKRKSIVDENNFLVVGPSVEKQLMRAYNKLKYQNNTKKTIWIHLLGLIATKTEWSVR